MTSGHNTRTNNKTIEIVELEKTSQVTNDVFIIAMLQRP